MKNIFLILTASIILISCNNSGSDPVKMTTENSGQQPHAMSSPGKMDFKEAVVLEALQAGTYTYVRMEEDGKEYWAAITARPVETGKSYYYNKSMLMRNFESKQLGRTFDSIMFIETFTEEIPDVSAMPGAGTPQDHIATQQKQHLSVEHSDDEVSLAELFSNKKEYEGKEVLVKGNVVKISRDIMNKNWIHIQDGTSHDGQFDLTITITEDVTFKLNETVAFKGTIVLDKDFGAGYFYSIIMEDARVINKAI